VLHIFSFQSIGHSAHFRYTCESEETVATINKTPSNTWKALIRKRG